MTQISYLAPGITTESIPGPVIRGFSAAGSTLGLVGKSVGYRQTVETVNVPATNPSVKFSKLGIDKTSVVVKNPGTGQVYEETKDYTLSKVTNEETYTVTRVAAGKIQAGDFVQVSYKYTPANFYEKLAFSDTDEIFEAYGAPFDSNGVLQSEISYAAQIAFLNGADSVVCAAVKSASGTVTPTDITNALDKLSTDATIGVVAVVSGAATTLPLVRQHVSLCSNQGYERRAVFGLDGVAATADTTARVQAAKDTSSERVMLVGPSKVQVTNPVTAADMVLGSQYLAVAVAALATTLPPQMPLTRKSVVGFTDLPEVISTSSRSVELSNGVAVVERSVYGPMQIVHGTTTNVSSVDKREWSVTGQLDQLARVIRETFDNDKLIGGIINDVTLVNVKASADTALQSLVTTGAILGYQSLKVRQLSESLDTIEVRFEWRPSMPLNYISIKFSMDLTTGDAEYTTA